LVLTFTFTVDPGSGQDTANAAVSTTATNVIPEPSSILLALVGVPILGIPTWIRRRSRGI
jgi:hypothetical protein